MYIVTTLLLLIVDICYAQMSGKGDNTYYDKLFPEINELIFPCYAAGFSSLTLILTLDIQKTCVKINIGDDYPEAMTTRKSNTLDPNVNDGSLDGVYIEPSNGFDGFDEFDDNSLDHDYGNETNCTNPRNYQEAYFCKYTNWNNLLRVNTLMVPGDMMNAQVSDVSVCCAFKHLSHEAQELHLECHYSGTQSASTRYEFIGQM